MTVYLLRHGIAEDAPPGGDDRARRLTPRGRTRMAVAARGLSVKQQLEGLFKKVGAAYMVRLNLRLAPEVQKRLGEKLKRDWERFDGKKVTKLDRTDGLKLEREDGSWVLMRLSGTEPVVRVYCEAATQAELDHLAEAARAFVEKP